MSQRMITAGRSLSYAVEETPGTRPTTGYKKVPEIKTMPSFNPQPSTVDSTTLEETEWMTYEMGLKDPGGVLEFGANMTNDLDDFWEEAVAAYETAIKDNKHVWWCISHPKLDNARFFPGAPAAIGINEASVNSMEETTLYIVPTGAIVKAEPPTFAEAISTKSSVKIPVPTSTKKTQADDVTV